MTIAAGSVATTAYERGRDVYNYRCYFCHGYGGDANTLASTYLVPPPRNFTATDPNALSREAMVKAVTDGKAGTAMMAFSAILSKQEVDEVVDFIRAEFMSGQRRATRYHTAANGWPDHERYRSAYPFVTGELSLEQPVEALSAQGQAGRSLYLSACITCHDRPRAAQGEIFNRRSISFPRGMYDHQKASGDQVDAVSGATPYASHDAPPDETDKQAPSSGEKIFQDNCAFCHGADGTGKNWIGSFLQPHPRDLTENRAWSREHLLQVVREGIPGSTMSAWRNVLTEQEIESVVDYVLNRVEDQPTQATKTVGPSG